MNSNNPYNSFSLLAIGIEPECAEYIRKVLKEGMYFFNHWYDVKNGVFEPNANADFIKGLYGNRPGLKCIMGHG